MDINNRLKRFIQSTGLSDGQFADKAGIPRPSLSQILSGRNKKISHELISKLHYTFPGLNILWLMFGDDEDIINTEPMGKQEAPREENEDVNIKDYTVSQGKNYINEEKEDDIKDLKRRESSNKNEIYSGDKSDKTDYVQHSDSPSSKPYKKEETVSIASDAFYATDDYENIRIGINSPSRHRATYVKKNKSEDNTTPKDNPEIINIKSPRTIKTIMVFYDDSSYAVFRPSEL